MANDWKYIFQLAQNTAITNICRELRKDQYVQVLWLFKHSVKWYASLKPQEDTAIILPGNNINKNLYLYTYA